MNKKFIKRIIAASIVAASISVTATGCIPGDGANSQSNPAGFFSGVWHGWVAPISLIISIFDKNISIYETNNNGLLYNLGYYMAVISPFGGLTISRKK